MESYQYQNSQKSIKANAEIRNLEGFFGKNLVLVFVTKPGPGPGQVMRAAYCTLVEEQVDL